MELSKFGKFVRTRRLITETSLGEMADALEVSSSFLSSVEAGRKSVPKDWIKKVPPVLGLDENETLDLRKCIDGETGTKKINVDSPEAAVFLAAFTRNYHRLNGETLTLLTEIVENGGGSK